MTRDEQDGEREMERDDELHRLLARWSPSPLPEGMDGRMLEAYRRQAGGGQAWWERLLTASVRVPLPVAAFVLLLLMLTAALALRPAPPTPTTGAATPAEPAPGIRKIETPVVTRTSLAGFQPVAEVTATVVTDTAERRR